MEEKRKKELSITCFSENSLVFTNKLKEIEITKYSDGDIEIELEEGDERINYIFNKKQVEFLKKWLKKH